MEIVRNGFERYQATGEFADDIVTEDFVWDMSNFHGWPEQQVYAGAEGARLSSRNGRTRGRTGNSR